MKRKSLSLLLSGLLTVCLTGVGFASWLIVQGEEKEATTGEVVVETVEDKKMSITTSWKDSKDTFNFTGIAGANTGWLRSDTTKPELLSLTLVVTVQNAAYDADQTIDIEFEASNPTNYTTVTTADKRDAIEGDQTYLIAPSISDHAIVESNIAGDGSYTFELPITFQWGQFFEKKNPYTYYQGKDYSTNVNEAKTALGELYTLLDKMSFTITLTTA